eukprot:CCRYP_014230-RA/>CCRYP_014230-RA protein AED:0.03 eAED:0.03 QI:669/1/1/1/1/1/2/2485/342
MPANELASNFDHLSLTTDAIAKLHNEYHVIIDEFLPSDFANRLLHDAEALYTKGYFTQHYFQFGGSLLKKPNVYELDLSGPTTLNDSEMGAWGDVLSDVGPMFVRKMDDLDRSSVTTTAVETAGEGGTGQVRRLSLDIISPPAIKLQINSGGGSFPWHYDNPGPPNKRSLTCVVYLNPKWSDGDGGEIVLWPFLDKQIIIPPLHRRAVLFYSDCMLHRVLPSNERRVCFTMWCNGTHMNTKNDVALSKDQLQFTSYDEAQAFFASRPLQRVISRAVHSEEYLGSLLECLVVTGEKKNNNQIPKEEEDQLVKQHESSVMGITAKLRPLIEEFRRRKVRVVCNT